MYLADQTASYNLKAVPYLDKRLMQLATAVYSEGKFVVTGPSMNLPAYHATLQHNIRVEE